MCKCKERKARIEQLEAVLQAIKKLPHYTMDDSCYPNYDKDGDWVKTNEIDEQINEVLNG